jgi:hypothetical protein
MGSSTRHAVLVALAALGSGGCVTGHLLDAAGRWEQPVEVQAATVARDRLWLAYETVVTDAAGAPCGRRERRAAVSLEELRGPDRPVETIRVSALADDAALPGSPVPIVRSDRGVPPDPALVVVEPGPATPMALVLRTSECRHAPLYANALARRTTRPWAYPLLPLAVAVDAVGVPGLLFFAPAVIVIGD